MEGSDIDDVFFPPKTCKEHLHELMIIVKITNHKEKFSVSWYSDQNDKLYDFLLLRNILHDIFWVDVWRHISMT